MMRTGLDRLFRPKSIAVVGGGPWGAAVIEQCQKIGFSGPIWPVHPTKAEMGGLATFASVADLPAVPDATFIGVNRKTAIEVAGALSAIGAGGAVCFASGFLEAKDEASDGAQLQQQLIAAAGEMALIGPNCYGFINYLDRAMLWPDFHGGLPCDSGVAIVMQSSNIAINLTMQRRSLPIAYMATAGNQAQTGISQIGAALLDDPRVTALGLHIEGIDDVRAVEALAAKARALGKPVIVLKVGRSAQSQAATISHTASLAGSDAGSTALFKRLGIGQTTSLPEFLETLKLLHVVGPLGSNRIASMSCSGGEASLMADHAVSRKVMFPALNKTQDQKLAAALGPMVKRANPLDYHTYIWDNGSAMADTFAAMMDDTIALGMVVLDFPRPDRFQSPAWDTAVKAIITAQKRSQRPMAVVASLPENMPEEMAAHLIKFGIAPICGLQEAIHAADIAFECGQPIAEHPPVLRPLKAKEIRLLTEAVAKDALQEFGVKIPQSKIAQGAQAAIQAATDIGFPVVLKATGIAHKTENGAVALNLQDADMLNVFAAKMQGTDFLVEEMLTGSIAEMLIGIVLDPAHGYVLTIGAGGTLTELLDDTASLLLPASRNEIIEAITSLKIGKLIAGYRGQPGANLNAIVDAILAVQAYTVANHGRIEEVEINPLICRAVDAIAADALIRIGEIDD